MQAKSLSTFRLLALISVLAFFPGTAGDPVAAADPKDEQIVLDLTVTCSGSARQEKKSDTEYSRSDERLTDQVTMTWHEVTRWRIAQRNGAAPHGPDSELELERVSFQPTFTVGGGGGQGQVVFKKKTACGGAEKWLTERTATQWTYSAVPPGESSARPDVSINSGWYRVLGLGGVDVTSKGTSRTTNETCEGAANPVTSDYNFSPAASACLVAIGNAVADENEKVRAKLAGTFPENRPAPSYSGGASFSEQSGPDSEIVTAATVNIAYKLSFQGLANYEVVITPPADLKSWLPLGGKDQQTPGKVSQFNGKINPLGKSSGNDKIKVEIRLESSREPGIATNFAPGRNVDEGPDLRILQGQSSRALTVREEPGGGGMTVYIAEGEFKPNELFTVTVGTFDFGGHGSISFDSNAPVRIDGYPGRSSLALPRDDNANAIADEWEVSMGVATSAQADDDDDSKPAGDSTDGDGLSLYEEYRGFMIQGVHARTRPDTKDVFVWDENNLTTGYFSESKLAIHVVKNDEFSGEARPTAVNPLVVNFSSGTGNIGPQHVLRLVAGRNDGDPGVGYPEGPPGPPKTLERIVIDTAVITSMATGFNLDAAKLRQMVIAHELAHGTNVHHHGGQNPTMVSDIFTKDSQGRPVLWKAADPTLKIITTFFGGVNSGNDQCIMHYSLANFYRVRAPAGTYMIRGDSYEAYGQAEPPGTIFCTGSAGTGSNAGSRRPGPKAGDATCGNCAHQFCVNDSRSCTYEGEACKEGGRVTPW